MLRKAYLEITNVCNLACSFCHGTKREPKFISAEEFTLAAKRLRPFAEHLYFHLLGEPLLHPDLEEFFSIANALEYKVNITTNGTLLREKGDVLLRAKALRKVSISLHCYEVNTIGMSLDEYLEMCFGFCKKAAGRGIVAVMRLWNKGGFDSMNDNILSRMHRFFTGEWQEIYSGYKLCEYVFLEWGELFEWPDMGAQDFGWDHSCYGLRDQVGVLSDGTVVPCCLDSEGDVNLGNIFDGSIEDILSSERAESLKKSFQTRNITEPLCRRCGYAAKFRR
ncbi:MAG: SPASM domain-containing protein [Ruminococcus sp.]|nr:SPASM domain-containing protein [Ruminococcus sp.]